MKKELSFNGVVVVLLLFSLSAGTGCSSKPAGTTERPGKVDAAQAQKLLIEGNNRFVEGRTLKKNFVSAGQRLLQQGRSPVAVLLSCSEPDVSPELLFDQNIGDLLVVRTVGNVLDPIVLGSIEYGVEHYKAPLVVVMGHTNCGIIKEVIEAKEQCPGNIPLIQDKVKKALNKAKKGGEKGDALLSRAATYNVLDAIEALNTSRIIREFKALSGLKVIGAKYDAKTGKIEWYDDGGCDLSEGFTIPDKKASAKTAVKKWEKPSEKFE